MSAVALRVSALFTTRTKGKLTMTEKIGIRSLWCRLDNRRANPQRVWFPPIRSRRTYFPDLRGTGPGAADFRLSDGVLEWLKWLALLLMTGDHVNKALFHSALPLLSEAARICFPIFALVLAYNLRRPGVDAARAMRRLLLVGCIAQPFHALAFGFLFPLNILFTFALGVVICGCLQHRLWGIAAAAFIVCGVLVDYQWPGLALFVAVWWLLRALPDRRFWPAVGVGAALASLVAINGNWWALAAVPVVWLAVAGRAAMPRWRWAFYVYYPAHLAVLALLAI